MELTFKRLSEISRLRANRWHDGDLHNWSTVQWCLAMAGEAGETCNAVKKLQRVQDGILNLSEDPARKLETIDAAKAKIIEELADTVIYAMHVAHSIDRDLEAAIVEKFNAVSERYKFPERL